MSEENKSSRNSAACADFKSWQDAAREGLNHIAAAFVEEQKQMIAEIIADENIEFRIKLQLLGMHTGEELYLDEATGLCTERFHKWRRGESFPSPARQALILQLCETTILEWLKERYPLEQMINVIGVSSIEGRSVTSVTSEPSEPSAKAVLGDTAIAYTSAESDVEPLTFDPATPIDPFLEGLKTRAANCLRNDNIKFLGHLVDYTEAELLRLPNFGRKSLNELKEVLSHVYGARLGMRDHPALDKFLKEHPPSQPREKR